MRRFPVPSAILLIATCTWFVGSLGCGASKSSGSVLQESAQEMNVHMRFGRTEAALEYVAAREREQFVKRHNGWGGRVRVADLEMIGMRLQTENDASILVRVGWYRPEQQELKQTTVKQTWRVEKGAWQLTGEERADGDVGLLGEAVLIELPAPREAAQFPTLRI